MDESKKCKLKGGAQEVCERNARLLIQSAKNCVSLRILFPQDTDASSSKRGDLDSSSSLSNANYSETNCISVENLHGSDDTTTCTVLDYFCKPSK